MWAAVPPWARSLRDQECLPRLSWPQLLCAAFGRNSRRSIKLDNKEEARGARRAKPVRYTAARLHEKGVLLGIDDLQPSQ